MLVFNHPTHVRVQFSNCMLQQKSVLLEAPQPRLLLQAMQVVCWLAVGGQPVRGVV